MSAIRRPLQLALRLGSFIHRTPAIILQVIADVLRRLSNNPDDQPARTATIRQWYQSLWQPQKPPLPPYEHVTQIGDPVLRQVADLVPADEITSPEVQFLVDRMVKVMRKYNLVGLAAPQIGTSSSVVVMEFRQAQLDKFAPDVQLAKRLAVMPLTVLINPQLHVTNFERSTFAESCASVRGYSAEVARYDECTVTGHNTAGELQTLQLSGWRARIAQHELDHLRGVLNTDVMEDNTLTCTSWQAVNACAGRMCVEYAPK